MFHTAKIISCESIKDDLGNVYLAGNSNALLSAHSKNEHVYGMRL